MKNTGKTDGRRASNRLIRTSAGGWSKHNLAPQKLRKPLPNLSEPRAICEEYTCREERWWVPVKWFYQFPIINWLAWSLCHKQLPLVSLSYQYQKIVRVFTLPLKQFIVPTGWQFIVPTGRRLLSQPDSNLWSHHSVCTTIGLAALSR